MVLSELEPIHLSEAQRLRTLIPDELKPWIAVSVSTGVNPALIKSQKVGKRRFAIQIDLIRWQQLDVAQRNLLFWHEVARVQNRTVAQFPREAVVLIAGLGAALVELTTQNILLLASSLVVAGLAANQLYQRNRGERSLREETAADQGAIALAIQSGYSFSEAYQDLYSALEGQAKQTSRKALWEKYEARLQVLEIQAGRRKAALLQPAETTRKPLNAIAFEQSRISIDSLR